jgi:pseudouridine kinase
VASAHILVIGAASVDVKGRAYRGLQPGSSVPGDITLSFGGVARNVAENLARLGQPAVLISAVGRDPFGAQILEHTASAGVNVENVVIDPGHHSAAYLAVFDPQGSPAVAVDEMDIVNAVTPAHIYGCRGLFKGAAMLMLDANLSVEALSSAIRTAKRYQVPVAVDTTSPTLAVKLREHLSDLAMTTSNVAESEVLCGHAIAGRNQAMAAAQELVGYGVGTAIITLGEEGLCYATARETGYVPAIRCEVVDFTGAGDALTAAVVYGLVNGFSTGEAMRLGVSAATLTLKCADTVCPTLSLERLYDQLVI